MKFRMIEKLAPCLFVLAMLSMYDPRMANAQSASDDLLPAPPFGTAKVELQPVLTGLTSPVAGAVAPGHPKTLFIVDEFGKIWAIDLGKRTGTYLFADLNSRMVSLGIPQFFHYDERGLLGLAFHPDFQENGLLYTFTSEPVTGTADFSTVPAGVAPDCQSVVAEWRVKNPHAKTVVLDLGSRRELMRIDKPQLNHNGGALVFGRDELLYISLGDGGAADDLAVGHAIGGNGQSLEKGNVLGKILRIDPLGHNSHNGNYGIPEDNPRIGKKGEPEIYAYGFRNPFRMSFDSKTGLLWVGDVGQNDVEEIDIVIPGGNYGWPIKEGTYLFANRDQCLPPRGPDEGCAYQNSPGRPRGLIDPIAEYDHHDPPNLDLDARSAIIGGFVYRGDDLKDLRGKFVFGDVSTEIGLPVAGHLYYLDGHNKVKELIVPSKIGPDGKTALGLAVLGFAQDADGELYLLANDSEFLEDLAGNFPGQGGAVYKLVPVD